MPDDLIIKFFKEDLTEAEEQALSDRLASSVEEALRFGQHAEASYRFYGLPEPQWRGSQPPSGFFPFSGLKLGLWLGLTLLAGLSVWGLWKYRSQEQIFFTALFQEPRPTSAVDPASHLGAVPREPTSSHISKPAESHLESTEGEAAASAISSHEVQAPAAPPSSLTPLNTEVQAHHPHTNLEVMVKQAKPGLVTVRVLGPDGSQAVMLYQGDLQPGSWAFDWNGRLADGEAPPGGTYQIQVISGAVTLGKSVSIKK